MEMLCTYNCSVSRYCISRFSFWQILYMVRNSTVTNNSIAHLVVESIKTSDLPGIFKSVEGSTDLTQGQDFGCYKSVSLLYQICYSFFKSYLSQFILAASPKTISSVIHHHLHLGTLHGGFRRNCFLCRSLLNRSKKSFCCKRTY